MKKSLAILSTLAFLLLCGCSSDKNSQSKSVEEKGYFKEYTFSDELSKETIASIQQELARSALSVSSVTLTTETYQNSGFKTSKSSSEVKTTLYDDPSKLDNYIAVSDSTASSDNTSDGITVKRNVTAKSTSWDASNGYILTMTSSTSNGASSSNNSAYLFSTTSSAYKTSRIKAYTALPTGLTFYDNPDGNYTYLKSSISKSVTAVEWGSQTKEYVVFSRTQQVYNISKKTMRLTDYYSYTENQTNRDPSTGEWYDKVQISSYSYTTGKLEYGSRSQKSIAELNSAASGVVFASSFAAYSRSTTASYDSTTQTYIINESTVSKSAVTCRETANNDGSTLLEITSYFSSYSNTAQGFTVEVTSIVGSNKPTVSTYELRFDNSVNQTGYAITDTGTRTYLIGTYSSSSNFTIRARYSNNSISVESINFNL